ncbi:MAG: hypothetical protein ACXWMC_11990 [Syntrophales bacterium]
MQRVSVNGELKYLGLETIAKNFARVYEPVHLADLPIYRWLQIVNDVTILTEETRRGARRQTKARERALKVLLRLLEFIGFYLHVVPHASGHNRRVSHFVAKYLRKPSYLTYFNKSDPEEGLTRWILAKYPFACPKCGQARCHCVLEPWIFEGRREDPGEFFKYKDDVRKRHQEVRSQWRRKEITYFTLPGLFDFFAKIYRNSYYHQDMWKIVMHLSEEVGEATTELSRLQLLFLIEDLKYDISAQERWQAIEKQTRAIIDEKLESIQSEKTKKKVTEQTVTEMQKVLKSIRSDGDVVAGIAGLVAEKFKEEIADVFSWLCATIYQLNDGTVPDAKSVMDLLKGYEYIKRVKHQVTFNCPQCGQSKCDDNCLVENAVAAEIYEKVAQL